MAWDSPLEARLKHPAALTGLTFYPKICCTESLALYIPIYIYSVHVILHSTSYICSCPQADEF